VPNLQDEPLDRTKPIPSATTAKPKPAPPPVKKTTKKK
jgi:hypothetical protein